MQRSELARRLDGVRWNGFHTTVTLALGVGWLLDAFEVTIVGNVIGVFKHLWHLSNAEASWVLSIWFVGLMIGAYGFGFLADRFGRRRLFLLTLALYGSFTLLTAVAWSYGALLAFRLLTAIGVGAEYSAVNSAIAEFIPARSRGRANAAVMNFWSLGAIAAALVTLYLVNVLPPQYGWRVAFGFGALVALSTAWMRRSIPESPRWLLEQGRVEQAEQVVQGIEQGRTRWVALASCAPGEPAGEPRGVWAQTRELLRRHPGRVALGCALDFSEAAGYYGLFAFLALFILPAVHVPDGFAPFFYLIGNVGALLGGTLVVLLLDRAGRKSTVPVFYLLAAAGVLVLAASMRTGSWAWVLAAFTLANLLATGGWISAYPTFSEIFPTELRATGIGISVAVGRLGAFAAPLVLTAVADRYGMVPALVLLSSFWLIGAVAMLPWLRWGVEGRGRPLEAMMVPQAAP
ncbi:MAG: MFS transporter [Betaproteobacteria bacterium]|nr:MFS transporter [Betaproteobacteria bacterium]MDE1955723.1 MFS transporter [Betaproteobacteria bacterium]MDE2154256.1 MFS transporter [Betaproteobacteria bacterium]MDE2478592.1 MFS transporter [Betaproteobacteria bacterium]